ncbi:MAG: hypothetical protein ABI128_12450 [Rhodanobacter sp.]
MELDEMKRAWQSLDQRLVQQHALNFQLLREGKLDKARQGLQPLVWGQAIQLAIGVLLIFWAVAFWTTHWHVLHLLVCGLLVHLYGMLLIVFAARVLYLVQRVEYAAPVLVIQRQLADLRAWRVRVESPVNAVLGCFIWIPVLWMSLAWYGIDLWSPGFMLWAISSSLVGLVAVVLVVWLMRRAGMARKLEENAAGRGVQKAEAMLADIARFAQE